MLARTTTDGDNEEEERFVVLKREPSHFVLVKTAGTGEKGKEGGGGCGGQACFSRYNLPDVVRQLWQIEPAAKQPPTLPE